MSKLGTHRAIAGGVLAAQLAVLWPVWGWYAERISPNSDDWAYLVPWLLVAITVWGNREKLGPPHSLLGLITVNACYAALAGAVLPLVGALFGVLVVCGVLFALFPKRQFPTPLWGLLVLGLPFLDSYDFFFGYPLRRVVVEVVAWLFTWSGFVVQASGAALLFGGKIIAVDAPCGGIASLWLTWLMSCAFSLAYRHTFLRTFCLGSLATLLALMANVCRTATLFVLELVGKNTPWLHEMVGVLTFLASIIVLLALARYTALPEVSSEDAAPVSSPARWGLYVGLVLSWLLVLVSPRFSPAPLGPPDLREVTWPTEFDGRPLREVALSPQENRFFQAFPGEIRRYHDGEHQVVLRYVTTPTRKLHTVAQCLRASGFTLRHLPLREDTYGVWSVVEARRGGESYLVREMIRAEGGGTWSDTSTWYWEAHRSPANGPWWLMSVIEGKGPATGNPTWEN